MAPLPWPADVSRPDGSPPPQGSGDPSATSANADIAAVAEGAVPGGVGSALRGGAVYAGAAAFQRGLLFLLLPVYTRSLDTAAYGRLSVLLAIATAATILLTIGMEYGFFRTYFELRSDPDRQRRFVTTAWVFLLVAAPSGAAVLALAATPLLVNSDIVPPGDLALALAGAALFVGATVVPLALLRAEERLRDYVLLTGVIALTTAGGTFLAIVVLDAGVAGWFVAVIAANAVTLLVAMRMIPLRLSAGVDRRLLGGALALGLPLVPHMLSHWGLGISNRIVLAGIGSASQVGIYALAANVALPVAILVQGMAQGFMPTYARAATERAALMSLPRVINVQVLLVLSITIGAMLLGPIVTRYIAPPEYDAAADLVPWLTAGYGVLGLYFLPMNAVALTAGRTGKIWMITVLAAGLNFAALLALVPSLGLTGAAIATTIGYAVLLLGVGLYSRGADNPVHYPWGRLTRVTLVFVAVYVGAVLTSDNRSCVDAVIRLGWLTLCPILLTVTGVVDRREAVSVIRSRGAR